MTQAQIDAAAATTESLSAAVSQNRIWLDARFSPVGTATVDASTITGNEFTLTGADSQNLIALGVTRINATTFRYLFGGALGTGKVTASFLAGGWADSEGNLGTAEDDAVRGHHAGQVVLHRALGRDHPPGRRPDRRAADGGQGHRHARDRRRPQRLPPVLHRPAVADQLGTVGATAGRFVLETGDAIDPNPRFWGVATLETNFSALEPYGIFLFAKGTLQINTTDQTQTETLTLPGLGEGGADVTRTFMLRPYELRRSSWSASCGCARRARRSDIL